LQSIFPAKALPALTLVKWDKAGAALILDHPIREVIAMATTEDASAPARHAERIPFMQRLLDNPFLLLFLGVVLPAVLYTLWGVMELASVPLAK
jgi:hypothetical protein